MRRLAIFLCVLAFPLVGNATLTKSGISDMPVVKLDPSVTLTIESYLDRHGRNSRLYSMAYICQKKGRKTECAMVDLQSNEEITIVKRFSNK